MDVGALKVEDLEPFDFVILDRRTYIAIPEELIRNLVNAAEAIRNERYQHQAIVINKTRCDLFKALKDIVPKNIKVATTYHSGCMYKWQSSEIENDLLRYCELPVYKHTKKLGLVASFDIESACNAAIKLVAALRDDDEGYVSMADLPT